MILLVFGGFLLWGLLLWQIDRPSQPAWKTRNVYRVLNLLLVFLLMMCAVKLAAYDEKVRDLLHKTRLEVRTLLHPCE